MTIGINYDTDHESSFDFSIGCSGSAVKDTNSAFRRSKLVSLISSSSEFFTFYEMNEK